jgi:hypothetical protein
MGALDVLLALVRCELKARYTGSGGWQVSAKGALPVVLVGDCGGGVLGAALGICRQGGAHLDHRVPK